jgi:DNA recombination protein RmuC
MDIVVYILLAVILTLGAALAIVLARRADTRAQGALADTVQRVEQSLREQERALAGLVSERLDRSDKATGQVVTDLRERLARIDEAQKKIGELSTQVVGLQEILSNKQARGAFGEVQLNDLVTTALPPGAYAFQCTLSNGSRVDCLLKLPNPPGPIAIDAKFPLESYQLLRAVKAGDAQGLAAAQRAFQLAMRKHIVDIRDKYILPGETAESALLFLPSEAIYAELHANFAAVVDESYRARVWIVSPTTMMATLNTVRAVLKDVRMREQAGEVQKLVGMMLGDVKLLEKRVANLRRHFGQTTEDLGEIETSTSRIVGRGERIQSVDMGDQPEALPPQQSDRKLI